MKKSNLLFLALGLIPTIFIYTWFYIKKRPPLVKPAKDAFVDLPSNIDLPELVLGGDLGLTSGEGLDEPQGPRLKVLSGMIIPIYEQKEGQPISTDAASTENKLAGVRILGEVKNIGKVAIASAQSVIRFYDEKEEVLASKVGRWNQDYQFLKLMPGETNVYDLVVPNAPSSNKVTIELKGEEGEGDNLSSLKVKDKKIEEASLKRGGEELAYFKVSGILVNTSDSPVVNPGLYAWLKDDQNKVIGVTYKVFDSDILNPNQELEFNLLLIPITPGSGQSFSFETKTFSQSFSE